MAKWLCPKRHQKRIKIWLRNGTKNNNTSSHMLLDHCYAFGLLLWPSGLKKFFEEGDPKWPVLAPALDPPWPKCLKTCKRHWVIHQSFIKIHQAVLHSDETIIADVAESIAETQSIRLIGSKILNRLIGKTYELTHAV